LFRETMAREHLTHSAAMRGAADVLEARRTCPQGGINNKDGALLRREVAYLGWSAYFSAVVSAVDAEADKPDVGPLRKALIPLGVESAPHVWYVGDTAIDMLAARAASCTAVLLGDAGHDGGLAALGAARGTRLAFPRPRGAFHTPSCPCPGSDGSYVSGPRKR